MIQNLKLGGEGLNNALNVKKILCPLLEAGDFVMHVLKEKVFAQNAMVQKIFIISFGELQG